MSTVEFGSLFQFVRNGMNVKQDKSGEGLPIARIETISNAVVDGARVGYASLAEDECRNWLLEPGDILFSHINSVEHIGKCAVYRGQPAKLVHGMNLLCLRSDTTKLSPEFAKYLIRSAQFRSRLSNSVKKAVNQASVSIGDLKAIPVALPPLPEQRRIAEVLDRAEALRAKRRAALAQLDTLTQSIFLEMFGPKGTHRRDCSTAPLGELCRSISDGVHKTPNYIESGVPFVTAKNIVAGTLDLLDTKFISLDDHKVFTRRTKPEKGDVLVSKDGTIGVPCPITTDAEFSIFVSVALLKAKTDLVDQSFLVSNLQSDHVQMQIRAGSKGIAIRHLHLEDFKRLVLIVPPIELQRDFARRVTAVEKLKGIYRASLAQLDALFASLQHRAFRGEL